MVGKTASIARSKEAIEHQLVIHCSVNLSHLCRVNNSFGEEGVKVAKYFLKELLNQLIDLSTIRIKECTYQ